MEVFTLMCMLYYGSCSKGTFLVRVLCITVIFSAVEDSVGRRERWEWEGQRERERFEDGFEREREREREGYLFPQHCFTQCFSSFVQMPST